MADGVDDKKLQREIDATVVGDLLRRSADRYLHLVERVLMREHDIIAAEITRRLGGVVGESAGAAPLAVESTWIEIESLSRLRGIVGGRFQNLRDRWVGAGFPLREHRGDKESDFSLNEAGWIELSNWILKQGFESRLTPDKPGCLFELRAMKTDSGRAVP